MALNLDPIAGDSPFALLLVGLRNKIEDTNLSFQKFLAAEGQAAVTVFDQTSEDDGRQAYDPPLSMCPAVVLVGGITPPGEDRGRGNEKWFYEIAVMLKMEAVDKDVRMPLNAFWELIRTCAVGVKQPQNDQHLGPSAIPSIADYGFGSQITPPQTDARDGFRAARGHFILRFRLSDTVLDQSGA